MLKLRRLWIASWVLITLLTFASARAQDVLPVAVFDTATADHGDTLGLDVFFVIRDAKGRPVPDAQIQSAALRILDDAAAQATFQSAGEADSPIYISLLLDTSGSMQGALPAVLAAARQAIDQAPANAHISISRFSDQAQVVQGFSDDHSQVRAALDRIAAPEGNTCMYDTVYAALDDLNRAASAGEESARKAVILFTDGQDIRLAQSGPNQRCSTHTYAEVVERALADQVPINTIGIYSQPADINREELVNLAEETSAFSAIGAGTNVADLFQTIFTGLNSQYRASFELNVGAGPKRGLLELQLQDSAEPLFSAPFRFVSPKDYPVQATPEPAPVVAPVAEVVVNGLRFDPATGIYDVALSIANPRVIDRLIFTVEGDNGIIADERVFALDGQPTMLVQIDSRLLDEGREYKVLIKGVDAAGVCIPRPPDPNRLDEAPDCILGQKDFKHERPKPPPVEAVIQPVVAQAASKALVIPLKITREDAIDRFRGTISDEETGQEIAQFGPGVYETGKPLTVDMPPALLAPQTNSQDGKPKRYTLTVQLQTKDGGLVETEPYSFIVEYPPPVPWHEKLFGALEENPLILIAIAVVAILLTVYFVLQARHKKNDFRIPDEGYTEISPAAASPEHKHATLAIKVGQTPQPSDRRTYEIGDFPCTIGRSSSCNVRFAGDRQISRKHAAIVLQDGEFMVSDLGSDNGTWLDGKRLTPNQATKLRDFQTLKLGTSTTLDIRIKY
ncbi:MAG: FHA domain-containing protein [Caldilineaceae bacterium]